MTAIEMLSPWVGRWEGTNRLQDPMMNITEESRSSMIVTPAAGRRFMRLDYTWSYQGAPQDGSLLVGHTPGSGDVTAHWIDSWHNGTSVMACRGTAEPGNNISVLGSYAAPPGPDWGWRTVITPDERKLGIVMYNVWPEGKEELAVEMSFECA